MRWLSSPEFLGFGALFTASCVEAPALPPERGGLTVELAPARSDKALPAVRLRVRGELSEAAELALFSGALSDYHLGRIARRDLPATLLERKLPLLAWRDPANGDALVAPSRWLEPGALYTLAEPELGRLLEFEVVDAETAATFPRLHRLWPPPDRAGGGFAVYCGASSPVEAAPELELEPARRAAELELDFGSHRAESCVALRFDAAGLSDRALVAPAELGGHLLDPAPLAIADAETPAPLACADAFTPLGPGCVVVEDDRIAIANAGEPLLWRIAAGRAPARLYPIAAGARWFVRGFQPDARARVSGAAIALTGAELGFDVTIETGPPRPRVVLNEVLANPIGAEPGGEWIELVNDGSAPAELDGFTLEDAGGGVALPAARLEPGEFALLAREDFAPGSSDVAPAPGARLLRVPVLARNGISNSGEPLLLRAPDGGVASRFPALAARRAGVSIARLAPDAFDDDPAAFAESAPPGATPGAANAAAAPAP